MTTENLNFSADVSRLLDIVANALYSHQDVFLRELISNASDACDRLRYEAITSPDLTKDDPDFRIRVSKDTKTRTLSIVDNGIGMNHDELVENLGTIAKSGTASLMEQMHAAQGEKDKLSLIGQFGVGFYASFMVANKAHVISRRAGEAEAWYWESDGRTGFSIRKATHEEAAMLDGHRGTAIILHIRDEAADFLVDDKIKLVIQRYSDHINVPIYLGEDSEEPVNAVTAIWMRPKTEVSEDQYKEFYKHITSGYDEPLLTAHWKAEGTIEYSALLYIPSMRPWDLFDSSRRHAVKLYVRRVFITEQCEGLIYPWLRFLRGVVDSQDLPLNISRETLQFNPVISKIRSGVAKRVLGDLDKLSKNDAPAFETFWHQFGSVLKEGLYDAQELRPEIFKVTRFFSTHEENKLTSLEDYVSRMKEGQDAIYYISGENAESLKNSPQLEGFRARGLEVLFFTDTIDDFWLQMCSDYNSTPFRSVTKGSIDLGKFKAANENDPDEEDGTENKDRINTLVSTLYGLLQDEVGNVRLSQRLTDSPVCLVAADNEIDMNMERVLKIQQKYEPQSKRILEINPKHPLIRKLADMDGNSPEIGSAATLLLDQARIIQGEPIPDPTGFARRMAEIMEKSLS